MHGNWKNYSKKKPINPLTKQQKDEYERATKYHICNEDFDDNSKKVKDHCHISGAYRGCAHSFCNLFFSPSRAIPVIFHNLSGYDAHFIIRDLATAFEGELSLLPITKENYISFTKKIAGSDISLKFLDSYRFMASSLDKLASYMEKLPIVEKVFSQDWILCCSNRAFETERDILLRLYF